MYTIVYHDEDLNLLDTIQTSSFPKVGDVRVPYYIQEGAFDGVVDPSKGISDKSEVDKLKERLDSAEFAMIQMLDMWN